MSSAPQSPVSPEAIAQDATWLAQALDPAAGLVRLVAMNAEAYRDASFLDDRMLQQPVNAQLVPWPAIESAMSGTPRTDARWIFHIGHVGSTLLSRLLGELRGVLAVREPRLLRDLAMCPPEVRSRCAAPAAALMSRTFAADDIACVKATSFASEIAPELVPAGERALFLYASPVNYIGTILAGENSVRELHMLQPAREARSRGRLALAPLGTDADRAAAAWACEMTGMEAAADVMPDRTIVWAEFDTMLADMGGALTDIAVRFGFDGSRADEVSRGPLMHRYSKALEYEYSPDLRRDLIAEASSRYRAEIAGALAMLRDAAKRSPLLARALARAEEN
jgi:hypothetical protein